MSMASAMGRMAEIQSRMTAMVPWVNISTVNFEESLGSAQNNISGNGPQRLNLPSPYAGASGTLGASRTPGFMASGGSDAIMRMAGNAINDSMVPASQRQAFNRYAQQYGVPVSLAMAVGRAESNFNPSAKSPAGAIGVMQLMPATAQGLGVRNPENFEENIQGGIKYLAQMLDRYKNNPRLALAAYNAGPGAVDRAGGLPDYPETQAYVSRVMDYARNFGLSL